MNKPFPGFPKEPATNFWPYPKALNGWWTDLTLAEQVAITYILRHTWGFKKDADYISYSQFIHGVPGLDNGCGIKSYTTLKKALDGLKKKKFIDIEVGGGRGKITNYRLKFIGSEEYPTEGVENPINPTQYATESVDTIKDNNISIINNTSATLPNGKSRCPLLTLKYPELVKRYPNGHRECIDYIDSVGRDKGHKFINYQKQIGFVHRILRAGFDFEDMDRIIDKVEKTPFYQESGWDFANITSILEKENNKQ